MEYKSSNNLNNTFSTMWSASNIDFTNVDLVLEQFQKSPSKFELTPYTFTKLEIGRKTTSESNCFTPPTWVMLDHAIAVIWALFSQKPLMHQLTIDDLKWAYEFLRQIKNKKGENPPDVKVCLKEIQDRLIMLYARLTSLQDEDFDDTAAAFGDKLIGDATSNCLTYTSSKTEIKSLSPSRTAITSLMQRQSARDLRKGANAKANKNPGNCEKETSPILEDDYDSSIFDNLDDYADEELEKYLTLVLEDDQKQEPMQFKPSMKSMIPTAKRIGPSSLEQDTIGDGTNKEKPTKKIHCFAEMRSLKFRKSTKIQDNGEEAAYSNLKAEIRRLTINPNVSRDQITKFLKDWRSEQVDRWHNELKRLDSIEEFMKNLGKVEVESSLRKRPRNLKEIKKTKACFSSTEKFLTNSL